MVPPVARPRVRAGFFLMAPAMSCAACSFTSSLSRLRMTSMRLLSKTQNTFFEDGENPVQKKCQSVLPHNSAEAANHQIVPVGTIKTQHVHDGLAFGGIDNLANAKQR